VALTIENIVKNQVLDSIFALINASSTPGYVNFVSTGDAALAKISFDAVAESASATGGSISVDTSSGNKNEDCTAGTLSHGIIYGGDDVQLFELPISTTTNGDGFFYVSSDTLGAGDTLELTGLTLSATGS
jgi:hypothetical protein